MNSLEAVTCGDVHRRVGSITGCGWVWGRFAV